MQRDDRKRSCVDSEEVAMPIPESYQPFVDDIHGMIGLCEADFELFRKHRDFFEANGGALIGAIASILT